MAAAVGSRPRTAPCAYAGCPATVRRRLTAACGSCWRRRPRRGRRRRLRRAQAMLRPRGILRARSRCDRLRQALASWCVASSLGGAVCAAGARPAWRCTLSVLSQSAKSSAHFILLDLLETCGCLVRRGAGAGRGGAGAPCGALGVAGRPGRARARRGRPAARDPAQGGRPAHHAPDPGHTEGARHRTAAQPRRPCCPVKEPAAAANHRAHTVQRGQRATHGVQLAVWDDLHMHTRGEWRSWEYLQPRVSRGFLDARCQARPRPMTAPPGTRAGHQRAARGRRLPARRGARTRARGRGRHARPRRAAGALRGRRGRHGRHGQAAPLPGAARPALALRSCVGRSRV
jgi:hypothetical protein